MRNGVALDRCLAAAGTAALLLVSSLAGAQDVPSGPEKGRAVPALKVFDATGAHVGKEVDYAADRKEKPTVYLFIQAEKWDRPQARFVRELDKAVQKDGGDGAVVGVWVGGDPARNKGYLPVAQTSLQLQATALTAFTGPPEGPAGWGVNGDASLTAVVAVKGKVVAVFGYRSVNETDVAGVLDALRKARKGP